jgi:hypothetical protein
MVKLEFSGPDRCLLMWVLPGSKTEQDWEQALASFFLIDDEAVRQHKSGLVFIIVEPGAERPNATWRKRLAEQRIQYKARERHLVLVTNSILFRGVLNAVNWLSPPPPHEKIFVTDSIPDGIKQASAWRGNEPIPLLQRLV